MIKTYKLKCANGYKIMCEKYNSASEVVRDCKTRKITSGAFDDMQGGKIESDPEWHGVKNYDEALEYLEKGYQPVVDKLKTAIRANVQGQGKRISFQNDIVGYAPIVPLAILGVPNSMINSYIKPIKAKVIDVYYDGTFSSYVKGESIINTGAKLISAILALEQQGYRFNLYQIQSYSDSQDCDMLAVKLKDAMQPIDLKRISFPLTHTAFFRVIGFDWYSKTPNGRRRSGYGHTVYFEDRVNRKLNEMAKEMFGNNAVYINGMKLLAEQNGEKYLKEVLTKCSTKV
jgi:hypothetical protein